MWVTVVIYTGTFTFLCWNLLYLKSTIIKLVTGNRMPSLITVLIYWDILVEEKYSCSLKCTAKEHRFFFFFHLFISGINIEYMAKIIESWESFYVCHSSKVNSIDAETHKVP